MVAFALVESMPASWSQPLAGDYSVLVLVLGLPHGREPGGKLSLKWGRLELYPHAQGSYLSLKGALFSRPG